MIIILRKKLQEVKDSVLRLRKNTDKLYVLDKLSVKLLDVVESESMWEYEVYEGGIHMKKFIVLVLACICVLGLVACNNANDTTNDDNIASTASESEYAFNAKVLEIGEQYLLVEPTSDSNEAKCSDKIKISLDAVNCPENLEVGDFVMIAYDGMIQELYPAIIPNVHSIEKN